MPQREVTPLDARRLTGFTLMEMMLALILFATGTLAAMELFQRGQAGATDGENVMTATHLVQRRLEELRNTAYGSLANESKAAVASPAGYSRFSRAVTVTPLFTDTLRQVDVAVSWETAGGTADVTLQTHRSNTH